MKLFNTFPLSPEPKQQWFHQLFTTVISAVLNPKILPMSTAVFFSSLIVTRVTIKLFNSPFWTIHYSLPQIGSSFLPLWYHVAQRSASPPPEWCAQAGLPQRNTSGSRAQRTLNMFFAFTVFGLQRTSLCIQTDSMPVLCPLLQTLTYLASIHL